MGLALLILSFKSASADLWDLGSVWLLLFEVFTGLFSIDVFAARTSGLEGPEELGWKQR